MNETPQDVSSPESGDVSEAENTPTENQGPVQNWIDRYHADHNHPLNDATHFIGIPAIVISLFVFFIDWRWGVGLFVGGWILQFIGHGIEGNKPSFMKDPRFLLVGPLFILQQGFQKLTGRSKRPGSHS